MYLSPHGLLVPHFRPESLPSNSQLCSPSLVHPSLFCSVCVCVLSWALHRAEGEGVARADSGGDGSVVLGDSTHGRLPLLPGRSPPPDVPCSGVGSRRHVVRQRKYYRFVPCPSLPPPSVPPSPRVWGRTSRVWVWRRKGWSERRRGSLNAAIESSPARRARVPGGFGPSANLTEYQSIVGEQDGLRKV